MSARRALAVVAGRVEDFFLEPVPERADLRPAAAPAAPDVPAAGPAAPAMDALPASAPRSVIGVVGLARGCGATVVARALAAELAARDLAGTAAVASRSGLGGIPLATPAAGRLAGALEEVPGARTTAVGRLCLVEGAQERALADTARHFAPLVIDAGAMALDGPTMALADQVVLVASPAVEPALASVAVECVWRAGPRPLVVRNRAREAAGLGVQLPDSRMGAQLALGGRQARGELGRGVAALADLCEAAA